MATFNTHLTSLDMSNDAWAAAVLTSEESDFAQTLIDAYVGYCFSMSDPITMADFVDWLDRQEDSGLVMQILALGNLAWLNVITVK